MARPVQLAKGSKFIVLASVCVVVAALYFAREVLVPLALAILLTFLFAPLVRRLERLRLGRVPATLVVVLLGLGLVGVIGYVVERQFVQIADQLPGYSRADPSQGAGLLRRRRRARRRGQEGREDVPGRVPAPAGRRPPAPPRSRAHSRRPARLPNPRSPARGTPLPKPCPAARPNRATAPAAARRGPRRADVAARHAGKPPARPRLPRAAVPVKTDRPSTSAWYEPARHRRARGRLRHLHADHARGPARPPDPARRLRPAARHDQAMDDAAAAHQPLPALPGARSTPATASSSLGLWLIGHVLGRGQGFPSVLLWGLLGGADAVHPLHRAVDRGGVPGR